MRQIRMHGVGGQGVVTAGEILSNAFLLEGKYMAVMPSYGVERRGSDVSAYGRVSDTPIRENSLTYEPDYLLLFDPSQIGKEKTYEGFPVGGVIIACGTDVDAILAMGVQPSKIILVDGIKIAYEVNGTNLTNMVICGAFCKAGLLPLELAVKAMESNLNKSFVKNSVIACRRGYDEAVVYEYAYSGSEERRVPLWERHILECRTPEKPERESLWGNYETEDELITMSTGEWKITRPVFDRELCVKCGICSTFCTIQCISKDEDGYYKANLKYCKGCGVCAHECPKRAITMMLDSEFKD